eukprot:scaffold2034_cov113-Skeletonema_dohrnii-CCMP3373.AAC.12
MDDPIDAAGFATHAAATCVACRCAKEKEVEMTCGVRGYENPTAVNDPPSTEFTDWIDRLGPCCEGNRGKTRHNKMMNSDEFNEQSEQRNIFTMLITS